MEKKVMGFSLSSFLMSLVALAIFNPLRGWVDEVFNNSRAGGTAGFVVGVLALILSICAVVFGFRSMKKGTRFKGVWLGLIPAILIALFWIIAIVLELFFGE